MTRIIITAGKGGVGKSTVAAATAVACAERGARVLVMSVDSAHNLSDVFTLPLGACPTPIEGRLSGMEVDINHELSANWRAVTDFFRTMTANNPRVTELVAEECAVLPGMEEVFGLMRLQTLVESGEFDVVVVDAPPTADMLKLLRLPDVLHWFMQKYLPLERGMLQRVRPLAEALNWPLPEEEVVIELEHWYARVQAASRTLTDTRRVSVRLVMTPDAVALAETRRAWSWTSLLGMNVDAVIVNKLIAASPRDEDTLLGRWRERQQEVLRELEGSFADLPTLLAALREEEVLGLPALRELGRELFGDRDPAGLWSPEPPLMWEELGEEAELRLRIPFLKKGSFRLLAGRDGLSLLVGTQRRVIPLPPSVRRRRMLGANYEDGWLKVRYSPAPHMEG